MKVGIRENKAYQKRLEFTGKLLGKNILPTIHDNNDDFETPRTEPRYDHEYKGKPITHEQVQELEYKALSSEGHALLSRHDFSRAIKIFSQALELNKEDYNLYIERANCYIQVGDARSALLDVNTVLQVKPNDTRALLAKAEAFFSIGEFEFALVFFERGSFLRKDIHGFREGITKCKHAILDSINGEKTYQPNPNFSTSRIRKSLYSPRKKKQTTTNTPEIQENENHDEHNEHDKEEEQKTIAELLPEKVSPLSSNPQNKGNYLGELSLDYEYFLELKEEIQSLQEESNEEYQNSCEDKVILECCEETLFYLEQRSQFWEQQNGNDDTNLQPVSARTPSRRNKAIITKVTSTGLKNRPKTAIGTINTTSNKRIPLYETSRLQRYERKRINR